MKKIAALLERLTVQAVRLIVHTDRLDPPLVVPAPSRVWVTVSRDAGGGRPLATYYVDLDANREGVIAALGAVDTFVALRVRTEEKP